MRRPLNVTWLSILVFILGLSQWTRAVVLYARQPLLAELKVSLPLPYAIASAAVWGGALIMAGVGLRRLTRWGWWLTLSAVTGLQAQAWLDRVLFARSDYSQLSTGFALGVTVIVLAVTWGVLGRPSVKKRFEIGD